MPPKFLNTLLVMAGDLVASLLTLYGVAEGVENTPAGADVVVVVDFHRMLFSTGG